MYSPFPKITCMLTFSPASLEPTSCLPDSLFSWSGVFFLTLLKFFFSNWGGIHTISSWPFKSEDLPPGHLACSQCWATVTSSNSRTLSSPQEGTPYPSAVTSHSPPAAPGNHWSVFMDFPILDISHKCTHLICDFWRLAFSLSVMLLRHIQVNTCVSTPFFSMAE